MEIVKGKRTKRSRQLSPLTLSMASTSSTVTEFTSAPASPATSPEELLRSTNEEEDMANCLILLAQSKIPWAPTCRTFYECRTCDRQFSSFQALGGHRASHKRPRIVSNDNKEEKRQFSVTVVEDRLEDTSLSLRISSDRGISRKSKVHECSICGAEFSSGQALGGHMRRHRPIPATNKNVLLLDLNLPAPEEDCREPRYGIGLKEKVIVFSAPSLVDCHY